MKVNFKLDEEMRKDVIIMSRVRDKEKKSKSPTAIEAVALHTLVGCSNHCATKDLWQARPQTRFMNDMHPVYTARISNVKSIMCVTNNLQ